MIYTRYGRGFWCCIVDIVSDWWCRISSWQSPIIQYLSLFVLTMAGKSWSLGTQMFGGPDEPWSGATMATEPANAPRSRRSRSNLASLILTPSGSASNFGFQLRGPLVSRADHMSSATDNTEAPRFKQALKRFCGKKKTAE